LAAEALPEIALVRGHVRHRQAVELLQDALATGAMSGKTGAVDLGTVQLKALDQAVAQARLWQVLTKKVRGLLSSAEIVRKLRTCLLGRDWDEARSVLRTKVAGELSEAGRAVAAAREEAEASRGVRAIEAEHEKALARRPAGPLALEGAEEIYAIGLEVNNRIVTMALRRAMGTGGPVRDPATGQLDVSLIRRDAL